MKEHAAEEGYAAANAVVPLPGRISKLGIMLLGLLGLLGLLSVCASCTDAPTVNVAPLNRTGPCNLADSDLPTASPALTTYIGLLHAIANSNRSFQLDIDTYSPNQASNEIHTVVNPYLMMLSQERASLIDVSWPATVRHDVTVVANDLTQISAFVRSISVNNFLSDQQAATGTIALSRFDGDASNLAHDLGAAKDCYVNVAR